MEARRAATAAGSAAAAASVAVAKAGGAGGKLQVVPGEGGRQQVLLQVAAIELDAAKEKEGERLRQVSVKLVLVYFALKLVVVCCRWRPTACDSGCAV